MSWPFCKGCSRRLGSHSLSWLHILTCKHWILMKPTWSFCKTRKKKKIFIPVLTHFVHAVFRKTPLRVFCRSWMRIGTLNSWMKTPTWYNLFLLLLALAGSGALSCRWGSLCAMPKGRDENQGNIIPDWWLLFRSRTWNLSWQYIFVI